MKNQSQPLSAISLDSSTGPQVHTKTEDNLVIEKAGKQSNLLLSPSKMFKEMAAASILLAQPQERSQPSTFEFGVQEEEKIQDTKQVSKILHPWDQGVDELNTSTSFLSNPTFSKSSQFCPTKNNDKFTELPELRRFEENAKVEEGAEPAQSFELENRSVCSTEGEKQDHSSDTNILSQPPPSQKRKLYHDFDTSSSIFSEADIAAISTSATTGLGQKYDMNFSPLLLDFDASITRQLRQFELQLEDYYTTAEKQQGACSDLHLETKLRVKEAFTATLCKFD